MGSELADPTIRASRWLWRCLIHDLRRRGKGRRESGAFLLGRAGARKRVITSYLCYDDVDREAYQRGAIAFHAAGYAALWRHCREHSLDVLADVHSHPGVGVGQSQIDRRNPMVPVVGHTALIVPYYAQTPWRTLAGVGVYEYLGGLEWRDLTACRPRHVALTWW